MATTTVHGGGCCGARHIHTFRDDDAINVASLVNNVIEACGAGNHLLLEVILSNRQTQRNPLLLAKLAELGFVYTSAWTGNHGTPVHRFERTGRRLALSANRFNWTGMTPSEGLQGEMPPIARARNGGGGLRANNMSTNQLAGRFTRDSQHIVTNRNSAFYGATVTVRSFDPQTRQVTFSRYRHIYTHAASSFDTRGGGNVAPIEGQQHAQGNGRVPPVAPAPVVVLTEVFASFRDGRIRGPFPSPEVCRRAYPRVARFVTREVYSDGRVETSEPQRFDAAG